jgi:hypothetical protein
MCKIGVLMWCDELTAEKYGNTSYKINKLYCDKHGYDLVFSSERRHNRVDLAWEKLPMVIEYLDKYDYVIWIDADAHFYLDRGPVGDVIGEHPDAHVIFSGEDVGPVNEDNDIGINTGIFIVKNTSEAKEILTKWAYDEALFDLGLRDWEQGVVRRMHSLNMLQLRNLSVIVPYGKLQSFEQIDEYPYSGQVHRKLEPCSKRRDEYPYVRHFAGGFKRYYGIKKTFRRYLKQIHDGVARVPLQTRIINEVAFSDILTAPKSQDLR